MTGADLLRGGPEFTMKLVLRVRFKWFYQSGIGWISATFSPHQLQRLQLCLVLRCLAAGSCIRKEISVRKK